MPIYYVVLWLAVSDRGGRGVVWREYIYVSRFEGAVWLVWGVISGHCEVAERRGVAKGGNGFVLRAQELRGQLEAVHIDFGLARDIAPRELEG
jgi:hypothetical protein